MRRFLTMYIIDIFSFTRCDLIWIDDASGGIWNHYDDHG